MALPPANMYRVSEALAAVMDDIGVNERLVRKRRRNIEVYEAINTFTEAQFHNFDFVLHFGSQVEGSTTLGLKSDQDIVYSSNLIKAIQNMDEWKHGVVNLLMIQTENISPGYCYLKQISSDAPVPVKGACAINNCVIDSEGDILWKNDNVRIISHFNDMRLYSVQINGPAFTTPGHCPTDNVFSFYCKSSPRQATTWLQKLKASEWPSEINKAYCANAGCHMVRVGSKESEMPEIEFRISTCNQEKCLMLSLNIPQLMCYILLKIILKSHINPHVEDVLTSFMCKNVLLCCVSNSPHDWHTGNLLACIHLCLFMLKERVQKRNCPHFIIQEKNLLTGRMTEEQRDKLLDIIDTLMGDYEELLYKIQIDDIGKRLKIKLNLIPYSPELPSPADIASEVSIDLITHIASGQSGSLIALENAINEHGNSRISQTFATTLLWLRQKYKNEGDSIAQSACDLLLSVVSSTLGSMKASLSRELQAPISDEAFAYLEAGKESDVLSGRLKLASVLFCTGDIEKAERELKVCKEQYKIQDVNPHCVCGDVLQPGSKMGFIEAFHGHDYNEEAIKFLIAFCTRFLKSEINCVPHELRYEILRSYLEDDIQRRTYLESRWMRTIVVDSSSYLYFMQYKIYGYLKCRNKQVYALFALALTIKRDLLRHKETALNLLGQVMAQEDMQTEALECYIDSLKHRMRNNAARFLLCIQLLKLWKKYKT